MPKRTDISVILVISAGLALSACGTESTSNRSETTTFDDSVAATVSECIDRFSSESEVWGDNKVKASFVYDVTSMGLEGSREFWKRQPDDGGVHGATIHNGAGGEEALEKFLLSTPKGDTELFGMEDLVLLRINDDPAASFDDALRAGCARLRDGITVRQVTFSQGNS